MDDDTNDVDELDEDGSLDGEGAGPFGPVLPLPLLHLDGHPLAYWARRVWGDLTAAGIPVHVVPGTDILPSTGVTLAVGDTYMQLRWNFPQRAHAQETPARSAVLGAGWLLTSAVIGILTTHGYPIDTVAQEPPLPPLLFIKSHLADDDRRPTPLL